MGTEYVGVNRQESGGDDGARLEEWKKVKLAKKASASSQREQHRLITTSDSVLKTDSHIV